MNKKSVANTLKVSGRILAYVGALQLLKVPFCKGTELIEALVIGVICYTWLILFIISDIR